MLRPERISIIFAILLCGLGLWILNSFIPAIAWATILAITTWPFFTLIHKYCRFLIISASITTFIVGISIGLPLIGFLVRIGFDINELWIFIQTKSVMGIEPPMFLHNIPNIGRKIYFWWQQHLAKPNGLIDFLQVHLKIDPDNIVPKIQDIGANLFDRGILFILTLLILFFMYYSGRDWIRQLHTKGSILFGAHWMRYINTVAPAIRATMNGLFLVASIEAIGMGLAFYIAEVPSFILAASLIGIFSIIPGIAPAIILGILVYLWYYGTTLGFIIVAVAGFLLLGIFDSWARPFFIGNTIKLPFLPIFFSILGGFQTLGLIGIFLGPTIFVMLKTLWEDIELYQSKDL